MGYAYTPGLKVSKAAIVRKERKLPLTGEVLVKKGDRVKAEDVVAKTELPGNVVPINVAGLLSIAPDEIENYMLKKEGEKVKAGEPIAESKSFFGLFKSTVTSPVDGFIESISKITGQVIIREPPVPVEINAYIDGKIVEVFPEEGVMVETVASFIQGIFGVGGERVGILEKACDNEEEVLDGSSFSKEYKGKIVFGGSLITYEGIKKAIEYGIIGIVVGGIDDLTLRKFLGYDIGVAITGSEKIPLTLVVTEGFGKIKMAKRTFELLSSLVGKKTSINGATQIRAGVIRPEIIVPLPEETKIEEKEKEEGILEIGSMVRIIREPFFGKIGKVVALPPEPQIIETESKTRVLEVEFEDGKRAVLPRANVELMEE